MTAYKDITVEIEGHVQVVTIRRPPFNYFDNSLIRELAAAFEMGGDRNQGRARQRARGRTAKAFCAGADLVNRADTGHGRRRRAASLQGGRAPVPRRKADHRRRAWRSHRRRLGLLSWPISASPARKRASPPISRGWACIAALACRPPARLVGQQQAALLFYRTSNFRRRAHRIGLPTCSFPKPKCWQAPKALTPRRSRKARRSPFGRSAKPCAAALPTPSNGRPSANWSSRTGSAAPKTSGKASRRRPNAACRNFSGR